MRVYFTPTIPLTALCVNLIRDEVSLINHGLVNPIKQS